jgi:hypothetical protein
VKSIRAQPEARIGHRRRLMMIAAPAALASALAHGQQPANPLWDGFDLRARADDEWRLIVSPYTRHWSDSPEHEHVWLVGIERKRASGHLAGATYFSNSFGQPSAYVFPWGRVYEDLFDIKGLYAKWTAGLLYGYKEPYEDKVPFNRNGFSPGFVPGIGYEFAGGHQVQLNILGNAGVMLQFSLRVR